jgi:hypothetical protein
MRELISRLVAFGGGNSNAIDVSTTLNARGTVGRMDFESETFVAQCYGLDEEQNAGHDLFGTLKARERGGGFEGAVAYPLPVAHPHPGDGQAALFLHCNKGRPGGRKSKHTPMVTVEADTIPTLTTDGHAQSAVAHSLRGEGFDASEDGTGRGTPQDGDPMYTLQSGKQHAVAFSCKDYGADPGEVSPTLRAMPHNESHANGGGQIAVAFYPTGGTHGVSAIEDLSPSLKVGSGLGIPSCPAIAFHGRQDPDVASLRSASGGSSRSYVADWAVRRLSVVECEILQGFPPTYCHIDFGRPRKIEPDEAAYLLHHGIECWQDGDQWMTGVAADGNMYKAFGNSMAAPVIHWLGSRIDKADKVFRENAA